jgi:hypothetical protein
MTELEYLRNLIPLIEGTEDKELIDTYAQEIIDVGIRIRRINGFTRN